MSRFVLMLICMMMMMLRCKDRVYLIYPEYVAEVLIGSFVFKYLMWFLGHEDLNLNSSFPPVISLETEETVILKIEIFL